MVSHAHDDPDLARIYDQVSDQQFEGGQRLARFLDLARGDRVLDVGCGTGRLAEWMVSLVGPTVVGMDPLPERIDLARARAPNLRFEVGRAEDLGIFENGSFDAVCASAVLHWVEDKSRALAEFARVLRPGGRVGATTLAKDLQRQGTFAQVLRSILVQPAYRDHARQMVNVMPAATLTDLVGMLGDANFVLRELRVIRRGRWYRTGEDVLSFFEASAFGNLLASIPYDLRSRLRCEVVAALEARRVSEGILVQDHGVFIVADRLG